MMSFTINIFPKILLINLKNNSFVWPQFCSFKKNSYTMVYDEPSLFWEIPSSCLLGISFTIITNLPSFIGLYKLCAKFNFHRFVQKLHEFFVMVKRTIFNILNIQMDQTFFLNDIRECSCSIHKNHIFYRKLHHNNCTNLIKMKILCISLQNIINKKYASFI